MSPYDISRADIVVRISEAVNRDFSTRRECRRGRATPELQARV